MSCDLAADIIKKAMVLIHEEIRKQNLKSRILVQVHDDLLCEVPEQETGIMQDIIRHKMENAVTLRVPLKIDMKIGKNWLDMKPV